MIFKIENSIIRLSYPINTSMQQMQAHNTIEHTIQEKLRMRLYLFNMGFFFNVAADLEGGYFRVLFCFVLTL